MFCVKWRVRVNFMRRDIANGFSPYHDVTIVPDMSQPIIERKFFLLFVSNSS